MATSDFFIIVLKLLWEHRPAGRTVKTTTLPRPLAHYLSLKYQRFSTLEIEYITFFTKYFRTENIGTNSSITISITKF